MAAWSLPVAWHGTRSRPCATGMWGRYGVEVTRLAGDGQGTERGLKGLSCWSRSNSSCSACLAVTLDEHS
jgi:hypothetical protein